MFEAIASLAFERAGRQPLAISYSSVSAEVPHVDEPWYCCAEPNPEQLTLV
jgi:hypothetical protein